MISLVILPRQKKKHTTHKKEEGCVYNVIIGYIILLTKYNIDVSELISDALDEDDINSETWKREKKFFGNYWKT